MEESDGDSVEGPLKENAKITVATETARGLVDIEVIPMPDAPVTGKTLVEVEVLASCHRVGVATDTTEHFSMNHLAFASPHSHTQRIQQTNVAVEEGMENPIARPSFYRGDLHRACKRYHARFPCHHCCGVTQSNDKCLCIAWDRVRVDEDQQLTRRRIGSPIPPFSNRLTSCFRVLDNDIRHFSRDLDRPVATSSIADNQLEIKSRPQIGGEASEGLLDQLLLVQSRNDNADLPRADSRLTSLGDDGGRRHRPTTNQKGCRLPKVRSHCRGRGTLTHRWKG